MSINIEKTSPLSSSGVTTRFVIICGFVLTLLTIMAMPAFSHKFYLADDLGNQNIPSRIFYSECLSKGESFHWFPKLFCGFSLQGEGQVGMYHPLHLLLYKFLPIESALTLEFLTNYVFLYVGAVLLFKRWGFSIDVAGFAAFTLTFSGNPLFRFMHFNAVAVISHIPWLLLSIDFLLSRRCSSTASFAGVAIATLTGSQLLLGYPQWFWISQSIEGFYAIYLITYHRRWTSLGLLVWAKILGILLGSLQFIPTLKELPLSVRGETSLEHIGTGSFDLLNSITLFIPYAFRFWTFTPKGHDFGPQEQGVYSGTIVIILLLFLIIRGVDTRYRRLAGGSILLSLIGLILSLGRHTPLIHLVMVIPFVNLFRCPVRYLMLFHLGSISLAAIALTQLFTDPPATRISKRSLSILALIPIGSVSLMMLITFARSRYPDSLSLAQFSPLSVLVLSALCTCVITGLLALAAMGSRPALLLLLVAALADQSLFAVSYFYQQLPKPIETLRDLNPILPSSPGYRLISNGNMLHEKGEGSVIEREATALTIGPTYLADGYVGLIPAKVLDYKEESSQRIAGVGWKLEKRAESEDSSEDQSPTWIPVTAPLPRAFMVVKTKKTTDPRADLPQIDIATMTLVSEDLQLTNGDPGTAKILFDRPGYIGLETDTSSRQLLFLGESFHPGWQTTIDGTDVKPLRVNGDFLGCLVERGKHEIIFRFAQPGLRQGFALTILGITLCSLTLFIGFCRALQPVAYLNTAGV